VPRVPGTKGEETYVLAVRREKKKTQAGPPKGKVPLTTKKTHPQSRKKKTPGSGENGLPTGETPSGTANKNGRSLTIEEHSRESSLRFAKNDEMELGIHNITWPLS